MRIATLLVIPFLLAASTARAQAPPAIVPAPELAPPPPPSPQPPPAPTPATVNQRDTGFVVETRLDLNLFGGLVSSLTQSSNNGPLALGTGVDGGIGLGYKAGRAMFVVGIDLSRLSSDETESGVTDSVALTTLLVMPGVRAVLARSRDERVELFGELDLGFGHTWESHTSSQMNPNSMQNPSTNWRFAYSVGPGLRYWVHPQLAVETVVGVKGDFLFSSTTQTSTLDGSSITTDFTAAATSIFGSFGLTGVF